MAINVSVFKELTGGDALFSRGLNETGAYVVAPATTRIGDPGTFGYRKLAYIVRINGIKPIPWADKIVVAQVEGWEVVTQKGQFNVGDLAVYFEIDSVLPVSNPNMAFLEGKRLKTKMFRDQISQGLLGLMSWLPQGSTEYLEGQDVTSVLGVTKWVHPQEASLYEDGDSKQGGWISPLIPKTDEVRVQSATKQLERLRGKRVVITQKYDGTSATFVVINGKFFVCGRNRVHTQYDNSNSHFQEIVARYSLEAKMVALGRNIALQGEIVGPKINGNRHSVSANEFYAFNLFDLETGEYTDWASLTAVTEAIGVKTVPLVFRGEMLETLMTVPALLAFADAEKYTNGTIAKPAEGIVVKSDFTREDKMQRVSFKVISNSYLKKYDL